MMTLNPYRKTWRDSLAYWLVGRVLTIATPAYRNFISLTTTVGLAELDRQVTAGEWDD